MKKFTSEDFRKLTGVSRETISHLETYFELLAISNRYLNLISDSTLGDIWHRHFYDSAQLASLAPSSARVWIDIGSGGGFPGLVLALLGVGEVHLVERSSRKAKFLQGIVDLTGAAAIIHSKPIEELKLEEISAKGVDIVTARAVAKPTKILDLAQPFNSASTIYLLPAGKGAESALTKAKESWKLRSEIITSRTDPNSGILRLWEVSRDQPQQY